MLKFLVSWLRWRARRARKSTFLPAGVRTIVAVELTRLGDFVTILPALRALRSRFPLARTCVVTSEAHAPMLDLCEPGIDVISIRKPKTLAGFLAALRKVRGMSPDLVCSMGPANRNAALALATLDDPTGKDVLLGMCDRAELRRTSCAAACTKV